MEIETRSRVIYREVQRPRRVWWWLPVLLLAALMWFGFIQQVVLGIPFGDKPAPDWMMVTIWLIFGIAFPFVAMFGVKFVVEVREDGLYIRFRPFHFQYQIFLFTEMKHYKPIEYNSLKRFGGWGIRVNFEGENLYNLNGNEGIELRLHNGQTVVIGTQNAQQLINAMASVDH